MDANTEMRRFHNFLRILLNIDADEFIQAVYGRDTAPPHDSDEWMEWEKFHKRPHFWFIAAPTEKAEKVWALVERRQPASKVGRTTEQIQSAELLTAAEHALRSYQHGNASPDLAKEVADAIATARGVQP
jgi:hypothetical protein